MHFKGISRKTQLSLAISLVIAAGTGPAMAAPNDLCVEGDVAGLDGPYACTGPDATDPNFTTLTVGDGIIDPLYVDAGFSNPGEFIVDSIGGADNASLFLDPISVFLAADNLGTGDFSTLEVTQNTLTGGSITLTTGFGGTVTAGTLTLDGFGDVAASGSVSALGTVSAGTLTDGFASSTGGTVTGVTDLTASGVVMGGTLTDGTASSTGGTVTGVTDLTASGVITGGTVTATTLTDGFATVAAGILTTGTTMVTGSSVTADLISGATVTAGTFSDGVVTLTGGVATDGTNAMTFGGTATGMSLTDGAYSLALGGTTGGASLTLTSGANTKGLTIEQMGAPDEIHTRLDGGLGTAYVDLVDGTTELGNTTVGGEVLVNATNTDGVVNIEALGAGGDVNIDADDEVNIDANTVEVIADTSVFLEASSTPGFGDHGLVEILESEVSIGSEDQDLDRAGFFKATSTTASMVVEDTNIANTFDYGSNVELDLTNADVTVTRTDGATHGLFVGTTNTLLTGGVTSSSLDLAESAATLTSAGVVDVNAGTDVFIDAGGADGDVDITAVGTGTASLNHTSGSRVEAFSNGTARMTSGNSDGVAEVTNSDVRITFENGFGNENGLTADADSATLRGGTSSTLMHLDDSGATFSTGSVGSGVPAYVHGVRDGVSRYDAVNKGQLDDVEELTSAGVASVAAMVAIPGPIPGKRYSIGLGAGFFNSESAIAAGFNAQITNQLSVSASAGTSSSETAGGVGASFSW